MIDEADPKANPPQTHHKPLNPENKPLETPYSDCKHPCITEGAPSAPHPITQNQNLKTQSLVLWAQAEILMEEEKNQEASQNLKKCIELYPEIVDEFLWLGCCEDRIGYHYGSVWEWLCLRRGKGKKGSPYDMLSLCLSVAQEYQEHKEWYLRMIKSHPHNYQLAYGLANLEYNHKKFSQAEHEYKRVAKLRPESEHPYLRIAFIYCLKWSRDGEALHWAQQTLDLSPNNHYAKLIAALCNKNLQQRIGQLRDLIQAVPDYARPYNGLGNAYYNHKQYYQAISSYKKCIQVNDRYEHPYYGLGSIYNQVGDLDQSILWYKRCIEVSPNYDYPHYGLGIAYNNKNDMVNAIFWFKKCIKINPSYDCPYYALGNIYRISKDYQQAIHYYQQSLLHKPIDPLCFVNIALAHIGVEEYETAYEYFLQANTHLLEDKMLSTANIDYIKEQLELYLTDTMKHERSCLGFLTFRQKIDIYKLARLFRQRFELLYQGNSLQ